jgi:ligand-binding SRPBCC domain-containing protein
MRPMHSVVIERSTPLRAAAAEVWRHATSLDGINREMAPWLRMTAPAEARGLALDDAGVELGQPLFTSVVLLGGVVPVERMRVTITELDPGRRFVERSPMLTVRGWRHERRIDPHAAGCRVTDRVSFAPPLAAAAMPMRALVGAFFAHRHRQLGRIFNAAARS